MTDKFFLFFKKLAVFVTFYKKSFINTMIILLFYFH